ncbi:hypothetical protein [Bifidobacterium callitrichidarum]|uniref:Uncharacterized protein n=1 Tax=Bifidobacterium callitrichidarum TaxID=2052941 RepID=A0A2U2NC70_9BIFI|nr:hypothetical protein [Bifidobacterium callitrichidarum]PWG66745.1 hypothetical protein DF196_02245 [Bifidobacterium callitrichidarum]
MEKPSTNRDKETGKHRNVSDFRSLEEYRQYEYLRRILDDYPLDLIRRKGLERIPRIRTKVNGDYYQRLVNDWESALTTDSREPLDRIADDITQYGIDMRQITPLYGIMNAQEIRQLVTDTRTTWNTRQSNQ